MAKSFQTFCTLLLLVAFSQRPFPQQAEGAERPTMNVTRDPRPDILAHPFYDAHTEYRRAYNRPRFLAGWIAAQIEPTSQEAMVWHENLLAGRYDEKNLPPLCKTYYYPKPWEVLQTGPRPDFAKPQSNAAQRLDNKNSAQPVKAADSGESVPDPIAP